MFSKADPYVTAPERVICPGWVKSGAVWRSTGPLGDSETGIFARGTWQGGTDACRANGWRMIRGEELTAAYAEADRGEAIALEPFTLPDAHLCAEAGVRFDWRPVADGGNADQMEAFLTANMGGLAWARYHDAHVDQQLQALGWDGQKPFIVGKPWLSGITVSGRLFVPPPGRAWLAGWRQKDGRLIQPLPTPGSFGPHGASDEHDYATPWYAVSETEPDA